MNLSSAYLEFLNSFKNLNPNQQQICLPSKDAWSSFIFMYFQKYLHQNGLIVCSNEHDLKQRIEELKSIFPSKTILPYPYLKPSDICENTISKNKQQRKKVYQAIIDNKELLIITTPSIFLEKKTSLKHLTNCHISLNKDQEVDLSFIKEILIDFGFQEEDTVTAVGQFSVRGYIIDVFPYFYDNPIRIELWGKTIETIRIFNTFSQRSITSLEMVKIESLYESKMQSHTDSYHFYDFFKIKPHIIIEDNLTWEQTIQQSKEENIWSLKSIEENIKDSSQIRGVLFETESIPYFKIESEPEWDSFKEIASFITHFLEKEYKIILIVQDENEKKLFLKKKIDLPINNIVIGKKENGFISHTDKIIFLSYHNIFFEPFIVNSPLPFKGQGVAVPHFQSFQKKDWVIHENYGIGQFIGIKKININNYSIDCILLKYSGNDFLTLPTNDFNKISKYLSQDQAQPKLAQLGRKSWEQKKQKAKKAILKLAQDLIKLYAQRTKAKGFSFAKDTLEQKEFEKQFPYALTPDQEKAIIETKQDMENSKPMERLVCGDVGFGKTEVVIRAAFKCANNKKQTILMAPTTLLSQQLFSQFERRMTSWSIRVGCLNRFQSTKQQKQTKEQLKEGTIDIVIGTHKLLGKDIAFKNLGLIIIDEEQKFGVRQKEKLKEKYFSVDSISLSATPIPRSLHLSFLDIRPFSTILTPPQNRLSIVTEDIRFEENCIKKVLMQEKKRGGQSFFVYNRIEGLTLLQENLQKWLPNFRIAIAHGKIPEKNLERIMLDFVRNKYDILICTSIIEAGIDLSNVNTMIIHHPEYFGISELFQLRGRVGRSATQAYCFLTLPEKILADHSQTRINMLKKFTSLGSGYALAIQDLEIRGVGNILGTEQKGHLYALGYHTYCQLIKNAIAQIQGKELSTIEPKINYPENAFLDKNYIESGSQRISLYQKISWIDNLKDFDDLHRELVDRFGKIPLATQNLILIAKLSWLLLFFKFTEIEFQEERIILTTEVSIHSKILSKILNNFPFPFKLKNTDPLQIICSFPSKHPQSNLIQINTILEKCFFKIYNTKEN